MEGRVMQNKREFERLSPRRSILVKEDNGEMINYYHLANISLGGMFLLKKISSKSENKSRYTFLVPELGDCSVTGMVVETRMKDGVYGTAIKFDKPQDSLRLVVDVIANS